MNEIQILINRLKKIDIDIELKGNVPWIYLNTVNGNKIKPEDYSSDHGYTIAWWPVRLGEVPHLDEDIKRMFNIIRKYR